MYHMLNKSRRKGRPRRQHRTHKNNKSLYSYHSVKTYDLWSIWHHEVQRTWRKERNKVWPPVSYVVVPIPCSKCKDWLKLGNISGSYSFTEPSRITRVGNRNFMKHISAITSTGMYNTHNNTARKWHGVSAGIETALIVWWVVEIGVISVWGIGVDFISVWGSELTCFCVEVENDLV